VNDRPPIITVRDVSRRFPGGVLALDDVSLDIAEGEFFALLGPSGCGKTTLLRILAGFDFPDDGYVRIDGENVDGVPANRRPVNMVFQSYAVFPHMSVRENVAYGLRVAGTPRGEVDARVKEALELVQLDGYGRRKPHQLSGGERQRVALARALVKRPKVLLLDEPLSALDAKLREAMQLELAKLQDQVGITFVIVTHDQREALSVADRIAVINGGRVLQVGTPSEIYENPSGRFVADFIGKMNLFEATVLECNDERIIAIVNGLGKLEVPCKRNPGVDIALAVRPEKMRILDAPPDDGSLAVEATVERTAYHGNDSRIFLSTERGVPLEVNVRWGHREGGEQPVAGRVWVAWNREDTLILED
jgi:spermidine/putrescine ABC transporter ATP-binding subunit